MGTDTGMDRPDGVSMTRGLETLRKRTAAATTETRALLFAVAGFAMGLLVGFIGFGGSDLPIGGRGSLGEVAAITAAIVALPVFVGGYVLSYDEPDRAWLRRVRLGRQILDIGALALVHASICLLLWTVTFALLQQSFVDAVVFPFAAAAILGAVVALSAYFVFLSASGMTTSRLASTMAVFLVLGVVVSMLTVSNDHWWQMNLSALGQYDDFSAGTFNLTLIIGGIVITTLANYMTTELESGPLTRTDAATSDATALSRARYVKWSLVLIGVFLACVGIFHVDEHFWVHNTVASGMAVVYGVLVIRLRWIVPGLPESFFIVGYAFLGLVVVAGVFFATGYWNLTAVEILAFALIFTWLLVLIRMISAAATDAARASGSTPQPSPLVAEPQGPSS
ncbi:hypothetical protein WDJ51_12590 [Rathayibacter sp. YIM 133350]|uniref:hypothetical protein n=1 Tax=Rathayibacter sp. YIM 133350 TaxID=3131992 RepID=UPI00307E2ECE